MRPRADTQWPKQSGNTQTANSSRSGISTAAFATVRRKPCTAGSHAFCTGDSLPGINDVDTSLASGFGRSACARRATRSTKLLQQFCCLCVRRAASGGSGRGSWAGSLRSRLRQDDDSHARGERIGCAGSRNLQYLSLRPIVLRPAGVLAFWVFAALEMLQCGSHRCYHERFVCRGN